MKQVATQFVFCLSKLLLYIIISVVMLTGTCKSVGGGVFFDMPLWCRWRISVGVKARVVNWKQMDVTVGCPGMR